MEHPADNPDPGVQLKHYKGLARALRCECERLEIENSNLKRKLQQKTPGGPVGVERTWPDAVDGRK